MAQQQTAEREVRVSARNIGGINQTDVRLPPGVTVLSGRNATNRTSFLQAIMAALGSERSTLKGDADEGEVTLAIGSDEYHRTLKRRGPNVVYDGDPYLDDPELADLFAFLLENNEARQAVARGDDLREIIMRPIDTDRIDAEIDELEREKRDLDDRIRELERSENELTDLEARRHELEDELADAREEHADVQAAIDELDVDLEESRSRKAEIEDTFERLREARAELDDLEFDLDTERTTLEELQSEREELEARLAEADDDGTDPSRLGGRIEELRRRKRALDDTLSELQSVISFNEELLEENGLSVDPDGSADSAADASSGGSVDSGASTESDAADDAAGADALTDELLEGDRTVCWTCGSEVDRERIADTVDQLRNLRTTKLSERNELREEIDELTDRKAELEERRREREQARRRLEEVEGEIEATEERIATLEADREEQIELVESLEGAADQLGGEYDEVLEKHREANELELRIESLEDELATVSEEIEAQESAAEQLESLRAEREELTERLQELRTRVDRIEADAVESFNEHVDAVLDILAYENIDRIWIERRDREVREGRRTVERTEFDLHVIRSSDGGATYRDTVDHLSESEREVTGLVFALAGYLVHDVHEEVPFIILDSLESIDSERIARVVDYFQEYVGYLTVALLPEDAESLPDSYEYVHDVN